MKIIILVFGILLFTSNLHCQIDFDKVHLYFNASYKTGGIANLVEVQEDSLRRSAEITIKNNSKIELHKWKLILEKLNFANFLSHEKYFECTYIVDFLREEQIIYTLSFNKYGDFRINQEETMFKKEKILWGQIKSYHDFFLQINPDLLEGN